MCGHIDYHYQLVEMWGREAARDGEALLDNPYPEGSADAEAWEQGWYTGSGLPPIPTLGADDAPMIW